MNRYVARQETSNAAPNPLAIEHQSTFQQSHLTPENIPEDNEAVPTDSREIVPINNDENVSTIQSNGVITYTPVQPLRNVRNTEYSYNRGCDHLEYQNVERNFPTNFASAGTDV